MRNYLILLHQMQKKVEKSISPKNPLCGCWHRQHFAQLIQYMLLPFLNLLSHSIKCFASLYTQKFSELNIYKLKPTQPPNKLTKTTKKMINFKVNRKNQVKCPGPTSFSEKLRNFEFSRENTWVLWSVTLKVIKLILRKFNLGKKV